MGGGEEHGSVGTAGGRGPGGWRLEAEGWKGLASEAIDISGKQRGEWMGGENISLNMTVS